VVLSAPPVDLSGSAAAINTASGQLGYALGVVISSMLVTQLADTAFLGRLAGTDLPETILSQIREKLPDVFLRTISGDYPRLPQAVLDLASARYDQAFTTGMGQMFLMLAVLMFLAAGAIYLGMHRGLRAAMHRRLCIWSSPATHKHLQMANLERGDRTRSNTQSIAAGLAQSRQNRI
jgi:hypothetical protein